jgi:hypothetical protein
MEREDSRSGGEYKAGEPALYCRLRSEDAHDEHSEDGEEGEDERVVDKLVHGNAFRWGFANSLYADV